MLLTYLSFAQLSAQSLSMRKSHLDHWPAIVWEQEWNEIDLRKNKLESWPDSMKALTGVAVLRLAQNPIDWPDTLIGPSTLRYLDLWDTDIATVPKVVQGFESLEELDLRETYLDESHREALERLFPGVKIHLTPRCNCLPKR